VYAQVFGTDVPRTWAFFVGESEALLVKNEQEMVKTMADETMVQNDQPQEAGGAGAAAEPKKTETTQPGPVPYERFQEVNSQLQEMKRWRTEQEKAAQAAAHAAEAAEAERLAKAQEWQTLAEKRQAALDELKPYKDTADRYKGALAAILAVQRQGLASHVVELLDKLDPVDQLEYIAKHQKELAAPSAPQINAGTPNGQPAPESSEAKLAELRQRFRI
jgi:hypothetical protein